ncbi:MAG: DUF1735 domain-containing protein [Mediterranea sp.]|jgi:hypothetical protein|nr:DUF1735 domain-containing protein [Mediterranea sp.]
MKNISITTKIVVGATIGIASLLAGCQTDINDFRKDTPAEATNKVYLKDEYKAFQGQVYRAADGSFSARIGAKLVVNCTEPASDDISVKVSVDSILVDAYKSKHPESTYRQMNASWMMLDKKYLTIRKGKMESDTLSIYANTDPSKAFTSTNGYILPFSIVSASGYDAQVDYDNRVTYFTVDVTQQNGVGFEQGNNTLAAVVDDAFECDLPIETYEAVKNEVDVTFAINNTLVDTYNAKYGTSYRPLSESDFSLTNAVIPPGSTAAKGHLVFNGDFSSLSGAYLIPVTIASVEASEDNALGNKPPISYLIVLTINGAVLESNDANLGVKQTTRTDYKVLSAIDVTTGANAGLANGTWENMFQDQMWVTGAKQLRMQIDLGAEYKNITGFYLQGNNSMMAPKSITVSVDGAGIGAVTTARVQKMYVRFKEPRTGRYLTLDMPTNGTYIACNSFYLYTQP